MNEAFDGKITCKHGVTWEVRTDRGRRTFRAVGDEQDDCGLDCDLWDRHRQLFGDPKTKPQTHPIRLYSLVHCKGGSAIVTELIDDKHVTIYRPYFGDEVEVPRSELSCVRAGGGTAVARLSEAAAWLRDRACARRSANRSPVPPGGHSDPGLADHMEEWAKHFEDLARRLLR